MTATEQEAWDRVMRAFNRKERWRDELLAMDPYCNPVNDAKYHSLMFRFRAAEKAWKGLQRQAADRRADAIDWALS